MSVRVANAGIQLLMNDLKDYLVAFSIIPKLVNGSATNEHLLIEGKCSNTANVMAWSYNKTCVKTNLILFYVKIAFLKNTELENDHN